MKLLHRNVPGFAEPDHAGQNSDTRNKLTRMRDYWESVRYGPVGRVLGYLAAFMVIFLVITVLLWLLERYRM
jgi:hypothetical protein